MEVDVYPTDAEAFEAAAALAAAEIRAAATRPASVALPGGRAGRGLLVALAGRSDVPWERVAWFFTDERCVPTDDPRSNARLARDSLFVPRGIAEGAVHAPAVALGDPERIAAAYAETLAAHLATGGVAPVFDLVLLALGADGSVASLLPGSRALRATTSLATVAAEEVQGDPRVPRITITPPVLCAARRVVVVASGRAAAGGAAAALTGAPDPMHVPAALVRPAPTIRWVLDRAAAEVLLRTARPAEEAEGPGRVPQ